MFSPRLVIVLLLASLGLFSCGDAASHEPRSAEKEVRLGPNTQAVAVVKAMNNNDLTAMRALSTDLVAEYLDVISELASSRRQLCDLLLSKLPNGAERDRVQKVRDMSMDRIHGPWHAAQLQGFIAEEGLLRRYRISAAEPGRKSRDRIMSLEALPEGWRLKAIDGWPDFEKLIQLRNQENRVRYVVESVLKRLKDQEVEALDTECVGLIAVFESLKELS